MKYNKGMENMKDIVVNGVRLDSGEIGELWDSFRECLWSQIEQAADKKYGDNSVKNKDNEKDEAEMFTANDAHALAEAYTSKKIVKGILYVVKQEASNGKFSYVCRVKGSAFNAVRYELVRLGFVISQGKICEDDKDYMEFDINW